jgi:hypothetical protein
VQPLVALIALIVFDRYPVGEVDGEAGRSVVHYQDILDVSSLQELDQVFHLELTVWVRRAIVSCYHIVEIGVI